MRNLNIFVIRWIIIGVYVGIQYCLYLYARRVIEDLVDSERRRQAIKAAKIFFVAVNLPLLLFAARLWHGSQILTFITYPFTVWVLGSVAAGLMIALGGILKAIWRVAIGRMVGARLQPHLENRRRFLRLASCAVVTAPVAAFAYGAFREKENFQVEEVEVRIARLPEQLRGLRICQLTDIHIESFVWHEKLEQVVEMANNLGPDLIFLTGDFITSESDLVGTCVDILSGLKARHGIYVCLGNHEIYTATEEKFEREFARKDIRVLRNEVEKLSIEGAELTLAGIDYYRRASVGKLPDMLRGVERNSPLLLLSHNPNAFMEAAKLGVDLTFSGHTHGGQIALELGQTTIAPSKLISPFISGLYRIGESQLYVSRGIGTIGVPVRLNSPPEITLIKLMPKVKKKAGKPSNQDLRFYDDRLLSWASISSTDGRSV